MTAFWKHVLAKNQAVVDGVFLGIDILALLVDVGEIFVGDEIGWLDLAIDAVTTGAQLFTFIKDLKILNGASDSEIGGWSRWTAIFEALAFTANAAKAVGGLTFLLGGLSGIVKKGMKELVKWLIPRLKDFIITVAQGGGAWVGLQGSAVDAKLATLPELSLPELLQECRQYGVNCS